MTPNACSCRVYFGGDNHHKLQVGSSATTATEFQKLSLLETRVVIYDTMREHLKHVGFNEIRLATNHSSNNNTKVRRVIVTFKQP